MAESQKNIRNQKKEEKLARKNQIAEAARQKKKRNILITAIVVPIVVIVMGVLIFLNSNLFFSTGAAVDVGGVEYSIAEYNYYFVNLYYTYYASNSSIMPSDLTQLNEVDCVLDTTKTWKEYLEEKTFEYISEVTAIYNEAMANNYVKTQEDLDYIEESIQTMSDAAEENGYPDIEPFLKACYGKGMTMKLFEENVERQAIVAGYNDVLRDSFTYSDTTLEDFYNENKADYTYVTYRVFTVSGALRKEDYPDDDAFLLASAEAMSKAKQTAEGYLADIKTEEDFLRVAASHNDYYKDEEASKYTLVGVNLTEEYKEWLLSDNRVYGEVEMFEGETGYHIVMYLSTADNEYNVRNMRLFSVEGEEISADDYDSNAEYTAALEAAKADELVKAQELYDTWKANGGTEDAFADLAKENGAADGGYCENVNKVYDEYSVEYNNVGYDQAILDWLFDESRVVGDVSIVYTEDDGYCLIYYVGEGMEYKRFIADSSMREEDFTALKDELMAKYPTETTWCFGFTM